MNNRMHNSSNPCQGKYKRVLAVCSAGLLRSPTIAYVLSQEPYNFNTRACGADKSHALIPIDDVLCKWADEIVVVEDDIKYAVPEIYRNKVIVLDIPDTFLYRDPELIKIIKRSYNDMHMPKN